MIGTFGLNMEPTDEQREFVEELNQILQKIGITMALKDSGSSNILAVFYDSEEVKKKMSRNGGRKKKPTAKLVTIGEVKRMNQTMGYEKIAKEIGVSVSTLKKRVYAATSDDEYV